MCPYGEKTFSRANSFGRRTACEIRCNESIHGSLAIDNGALPDTSVSHIAHDFEIFWLLMNQL
jgi:hypothetical protein